MNANLAFFPIEQEVEIDIDNPLKTLRYNFFRCFTDFFAKCIKQGDG